MAVSNALDDVMEQVRQQWPNGSFSVNHTVYGGGRHYYVSLHAHGGCVHGKSRASAQASLEDALKQAAERWPDERTAVLREMQEAAERLERLKAQAAPFLAETAEA